MIASVQDPGMSGRLSSHLPPPAPKHVPHPRQNQQAYSVATHACCCRTDTHGAPPVVIREVKWFEGDFAALRAAGAPGDGPAYTDGDAAAAVFQVGVTGLSVEGVCKVWRVCALE